VQESWQMEFLIERYGSRILMGKMVFSRGAGVFVEFFEWLEGFGAKGHGLLESFEIFGDLGGFLEGLEWFRT
jgi:hypothetical protein